MNLHTATPTDKVIVLGTALWGWGVDRSMAHRMLDKYVEFGGCILDTAANYPINKNPDDFGLAVAWISEWIASNGEQLLSILVKVGATDNLGTPNSELGKTSIIHYEEYYRGLFGASLAGIAIHWDNRGSDESDEENIFETVSIMAKLYRNSGLSIGFSGVKRPDLYFKADPSLSKKWWIQVKENIVTNDARNHYMEYFPDAHYLAYGINLGGVKNQKQNDDSSLSLRGIVRSEGLVKVLNQFIHSNHGIKPMPENLNELLFAFIYLNPGLSGIIIGPRDVCQLECNIRFYEKLKNNSIQSMWNDFLKNTPLSSLKSKI